MTDSVRNVTDSCAEMAASTIQQHRSSPPTNVNQSYDIIIPDATLRGCSTNADDTAEDDISELIRRCFGDI